MMKQNIVMTDFKVQKEWIFLTTIRNETGQDWDVKSCDSSKNRGGKVENLKRYLKYFIFSFKIFVERRNYDCILSWQQFYGIIIGFYSRFFRVKKINPIYVMTFIYKPKGGVVGKLYYKFIKFSISSKYINRIICFSSTEPEYYSNLFAVERDKFVYIPLGEDLISNTVSNMERHGVVSAGFSNRDYDFLISVFEELPYELKIYADHDERFADNIVMTGERMREHISEVLNKSELLVIPLQDKEISAGQLTVLHAMQSGVPVVATNSNGLKDYIENGKNGYLIDNDVILWRNTIKHILTDKDIWNSMASNTKLMYESNHTVKGMAKNIARIVTVQGG